MSMAEIQANLQARYQQMDNPEGSVFKNAVAIERGLQECRDGLASLQTPDKGQMSEAAYQEHARGVEQALKDLRSRMSEHEKKFNKGERQMRQLQEDVAGVKKSAI